MSNDCTSTCYFLDLKNPAQKDETPTAMSQQMAQPK